MDQSRIEDAIVGVTMDDGSSAFLFNNVFNRNHIGIRNGDGTAGFGTLNVLSFSNNLFDGSSALNALPTGVTVSPAYTGRAYAGIYLNSVVGSISSIARSKFTRMHFGVVMNNADFALYNCTFTNLTAMPTITFDRVGIWCQKGRLVSNSSFFSGSTHGIFADGAEINVTQDTFFLDVTNSTTGVRSLNNINTDFIVLRNNRVDITGNAQNVTGLHYGFFIQRNSRSGEQTSFNISDNELTMEGAALPLSRYSQFGIYVDGTNPSLDIATILNNRLTVTARYDFRQNGIHVYAGAADNFRINNNYLTFTQNTTAFNSTLRWGIAMVYGTGGGHAIRDNTSICVSNPPAVGNFSSMGYCGYHIEEVANVTLCGNFTDQFEHGIHYLGNCPGNVIGNNTMHNHVNGIRLQNNPPVTPPPGSPTMVSEGFLGRHIRTGNRWDGTYVQNGALNNSSLMDLPQFIVNQFVLPQNSVAPVSPPNGQWMPSNFITNITATGELGCPPPPPGFTDGSDDRFVLNNTGNGNTFMTFESDRYIVRKMLNNPYLQGQNSIYDAFYSNKLNSPAGLMAQFDNQMRSAVTLPESVNIGLNQSNTDRDGILNDLKTIDAANSAYTAQDFSNQADAMQLMNALAVQKRSVLGTLKNNFVHHNDLHQSFESTRTAAITQALNTNAAISTANEIGTAWKTVNKMVALKALGAMNDAAYGELLSVAQMCPANVGDAPMNAVYMLNPEHAVLYFPQDEMTGLNPGCSQRSDRSEENTGELEMIRAFPNPVSNLLRLESDGIVKGNWLLVNLKGITVLSGRIPESTVWTINVSNQPAGVYQLKFENTGQRIASKKIEIIK